MSPLRAVPDLARFYITIVLLVLLVITGVGIMGQQFWLRRQAAQVPALKQDVKTAVENTKSADQGAANATETRAKSDAQVVVIREQVQTVKERIETNAKRHVDDVGSLDPLDRDSLQELSSAENRARAAADRLQRKGSR